MKILGYEIKKIKDTNQKRFEGYSSNGFSYFSNNIAGCGQVRINLDDLFSLKKRNSDINSSIDLISQKVALKGLYLEGADGSVLDKNKYKKEHSYLMSLFSQQTFSFFKESFFTQTLIAGENYLEPIRNLKNKISRFGVMDARAMSKIISEDGSIIKFKQYSKNGKSQEFTRDELAYFMYKQDPTNENLSMGKLDGIIFDVLGDIEASRRNFYFFKNDSVPNALFMLDEELSQEQMQMAGEQIREQFSGSENAHKFLVNSGIKDVKLLSLSPKDMEFINQRVFSTDKICAAFGVDKRLIGYSSDVGNYSMMKEIRKEFQQGTIAAHESYFENIINACIQKYKKDLEIDLSGYTIKCDSESFDDRTQIEESQRKDIQMGIITINEVRIERGLDKYNIQQADTPYIASNLVPLEQQKNL